jgi:uncharacterized protein (DUF362 family)/Pyruvate/2-oxoacid:ferredoxin oxidoreductase delta subunit
MQLSRKSFIIKIILLTGYIVLFLFMPFNIRLKRRAYADKKALRNKGKTMKKKGKDIVSIEPCRSYDPEEVYKAVKHGLASLKFRIKPGLSVLLKPNILAQNTPDQCATTHPALVDAVCRILTENKCSITIGESSAFYQGGGTRKGFETSGIAGVASKYNAGLMPFESTHLVKVITGKALNPFYITDAINRFDLIINLPKMKIHRLARYTGAIKNMYGFIPGGTKQYYHKLFDHRSDYKEFWGIPLVDVFEAVQPGLNIMDAVYGLDKDGPAANGEPKYTGLILMSVNAAALDVIACRVMGFDPYWVPAVREAIGRNLCDVPEKIKTAGDVPSVPYVKLPDEEPLTGIRRRLDDYMFDRLLVEPRIDKCDCTKCDKCTDGCASGAITRNNYEYPVIDMNKCIYCYCCEEYCTYKAISLHGGVINHIIRGIRQIKKI